MIRTTTTTTTITTMPIIEQQQKLVATATAAGARAASLTAIQNYVVLDAKNIKTGYYFVSLPVISN